MDPLRTDTHAAETLSGTDRDARIEQLLVSGLDEYFAHRYEHAINRWTRVLFLDRHHDRARAYIERARRAQAERLRESEALLQQGIEAFRAGDVDRARELVLSALDRGASHDEAHGVLERIERLGAGQAAPRPSRGRAAATLAPHRVRAEGPRASRGITAALLLAIAALGAVAVGAWGLAVPDVGPWLSATPRASESGIVTPMPAEPLPVVGPSEAYLSRARALVAAGRLRDALTVLARVPLADPLRPDADRLRADIQRQLLAVAAVEPTPE